MTPKIFELKQAPVVLVELPKGMSYITKIRGLVHYGSEPISQSESEWFPINFPPHLQKKVDIVGILSDLTEEQFAECTHSLDFQLTDKTCYLAFRDYTVKPESDKASGLKIVEDFFYLLLESESVYTENPYGNQPPILCNWEGYAYPPPDKLNRHEEDLAYWQRFQERTIDPTRTVVLLRREEAQ